MQVVAASIEVSRRIARHGKSLSDSEFLKQTWLECESKLFEDFQNKIENKFLQQSKIFPPVEIQ
jgi:hypothetical protein